MLGTVSCGDYLRECLRLAPREALPTFFPELVCLLPDIEKQEVGTVPKTTLVHLHRGGMENIFSIR